jgi:hypothetical protein
MLDNSKERENIVDILNKAKRALQEDDVILLRQLSNRTVHTASIYKDLDSILVAVTVYALSKIIERKKFEEYKSWPNFFNICVQNIELAEQNLRQDKIKEFRENLVEIRKAAEKLSGNLKKYITDIFERAAVNKASRLYEHGLSLSETAELFGITQWELAEYVGRTGISDVDLSLTMPVKERINFTKKLFGK